MKKICSSVAICFAVLCCGSAHAQLADKKVLTVVEAKKAMAAAVAEAEKNGWGMVIAVVDESGFPILLERMDKAQKASVDIAVGKARTAALFRRPSGALEEAIAKGRTALVSVEGYAFLQGALPIVISGEIIGAIGVSGMASNQDEQVARVGVDAVMKGK